MITKDEKDTIYRILSVFETGVADGDYGAVAVLADGAGISYGLHQATDKADSLDEIVRTYLTDPEAKFPAIGQILMEHLDRDDTASLAPGTVDAPGTGWPSWTLEGMKLLQQAGREDPAMRRAQDAVFDKRYWQPCVKICEEMGLQLPLSWCTVYDTCIQSGPDAVAKMRRRFPEKPPSSGGTEYEWVQAYLEARDEWLAAHANARVRLTAPRPRSLLALSPLNWRLKRPFKVLGITI